MRDELRAAIKTLRNECAKHDACKDCELHDYEAGTKCLLNVNGGVFATLSEWPDPDTKPIPTLEQIADMIEAIGNCNGCATCKAKGFICSDEDTGGRHAEVAAIIRDAAKRLREVEE